MVKTQKSSSDVMMAGMRVGPKQVQMNQLNKSHDIMTHQIWLHPKYPKSDWSVFECGLSEITPRSKNTNLQELVYVLHLKTVKVNYNCILGMHIGHSLTLFCIRTAVILIFVLVRLGCHSLTTSFWIHTIRIFKPL